MGTIGYMSPEQALGKPLDFRSDQFSLGSILYEMATGQRAFSRGSAPETLTAIIRDEPEPIASLAPLTPAPLRWIVERCLAKNPEDRYASTRDLARDLATLRDRLSETSVVASRGNRGPRADPGAPGAPRDSLDSPSCSPRGWYGLFPRAPDEAPSARAYALFGDAAAGSGAESQRHRVALPISPDGRWLVFVGSPARGSSSTSEPSTPSRRSRSPEPKEDHALLVAGQPQIGFFADGKIQRIPVAGGPPQVICNGGIEALPSWGPSGQILFVQLGQEPGLWVVDAAGGEPRRIRGLDAARHESAHLWPLALADGRHFLFTTLDPSMERQGFPLRLGSLDSTTATEVGRVSSRFEIASGHLLFVREGVLLAQPFDVAEAPDKGDPVASGRARLPFNGPLMAGFSASQNGHPLRAASRSSRVSWLDRSGKELERFR